MKQPRVGAASALMALSLTWWGCKGDPSEEVDAGSNASEGTATAGGTADESTGAPACASEDDRLLYANEGVLVAPMLLENADGLGFDVAGSRTAEMGTLTLSFTTTCEGPLHVWALVWDANGGNDPDNADSIYVQVDGGEEQAWLYGCDTDGPDQLWHWLPVLGWTMNGCEHDPFVVETLPAGDHTIVIRGREGGVGGLDIAAIAAVVVSHVEDTDPSAFYEVPED
jgi:hypothetical protein